jgi:DNA-binding transcriptional LysR family regulator
MDLRHFRAFLAIAQELHFTRAAERLGMAQPLLSQQIKSLEEDLGVRLFRRLPRGVELTEAGQLFRPRAQLAIDSVEEAVAAARHVAKGEAGMISIGFTNSASFNPMVTSIIAKFRQQYPGLHIKLIEHPTAQLIVELGSKRVDVAFLRCAQTDDSRLQLISLPDERLRLVLPSSHILAKRRSISLAKLAADPFVLFPRANGPLLYDAVIVACNRCGFSPKVVQEAPQLSSAVTLVAAGIGVTLIPQSMCQLHAHGVSHADIKDPNARVAMTLGHLKDHGSPSVDNFIKHVLAELPAGARRV